MSNFFTSTESMKINFAIIEKKSEDSSSSDF